MKNNREAQRFRKAPNQASRAQQQENHQSANRSWQGKREINKAVQQRPAPELITDKDPGDHRTQQHIRKSRNDRQLEC